jgi:hypothetical protein
VVWETPAVRATSARVTRRMLTSDAMSRFPAVGVQG